jgi:hypothetical protein
VFQDKKKMYNLIEILVCFSPRVQADPSGKQDMNYAVDDTVDIDVNSLPEIISKGNNCQSVKLLKPVSEKELGIVPFKFLFLNFHQP